MTEAEKAEERQKGHDTGWNDCMTWIGDKNNKDGIVGAVAMADNKLSILMEQEGISDIKQAEGKVGPYLHGLMQAYLDFIQNHYNDLK